MSMSGYGNDEEFVNLAKKFGKEIQTKFTAFMADIETHMNTRLTEMLAMMTKKNKKETSLRKKLQIERENVAKLQKEVANLKEEFKEKTQMRAMEDLEVAIKRLRELLEESSAMETEDLFVNFRSPNESKNIFKSARTPAAIYKENEPREPKSMLEETAEVNNLLAAASAKDMYSTSIEEVCGETKPFMSTAQLEAEHAKSKEKAVNHFQSRRKMGGEEFSVKNRETLDEEMENLFVNFRSHNESNNIVKSAGTPATLFTIAAIFYILSGVFGLLGMYSFANILYNLLGVALLLLAIWAYVRYSGEMRDIGTHIDTGASVVWEYVLKPVYLKLMAKGLERNATNEMLSDGVFFPKVKNH